MSENRRKGNARDCFRIFYSTAFSYSTVREVSVQNRPVVIIYRLVQLIILAYVIG